MNVLCTLCIREEKRKKKTTDDRGEKKGAYARSTQTRRRIGPRQDVARFPSMCPNTRHAGHAQCRLLPAYFFFYDFILGTSDVPNLSQPFARRAFGRGVAKKKKTQTRPIAFCHRTMHFLLWRFIGINGDWDDTPAKKAATSMSYCRAKHHLAFLRFIASFDDRPDKQPWPPASLDLLLFSVLVLADKDAPRRHKVGNGKKTKKGAEPRRDAVLHAIATVTIGQVGLARRQRDK